ncbi:Oxoglutarate/iron-dependent oxygenase [Metarhizium guizhouense ARSEF 977]|uniref:Oxoglutarate/iron-dependent oxygenase n=1 Tax=Metarhizium guizhouense (strain ARSEF 977) TaxID=1276136 RepID=A0A0B4G4C4_METGA|nr:Oxoglutarate/iron-dependent oxygenase [Metarhizium guizhouense ARSEF 977]
MAQKHIPVISLKSFGRRKEEITKQLLEAAEVTGFFTLVDHGITIEEIEAQLQVAQNFFSLPAKVKDKVRHDPRTNNDWEYKAQLRPSTGAYDQKESLWLMRGSQWPSDQDVPNFRGTTARFMAKCASISDQVCTSAYHACHNKEILIVSHELNPLGFDEDYLVAANDPTQPDCISQLRLLHYPATDNASGTWRVGAHTDIGCLTLLFQRDKQDGLEICTGRESHTGFDVGDSFTPIPAHTGPIVVNIGDMLMAWSDDRLKSNFHRVRAKELGYSPPRYSIAYFNQARRGFIVQGPRKKYPPVTVDEYFKQAIERNFGQYPVKS